MSAGDAVHSTNPIAQPQIDTGHSASLFMPFQKSPYFPQLQAWHWISHGHLTRAIILCGDLQENWCIPGARQPLCTRMRSRNGHGHLTRAILRTNFHGLQEQSLFFARIYRKNAAPQDHDPDFRASLPNRNGHGHLTRAISRKNLQEKMPRPKREARARTLI